MKAAPPGLVARVVKPDDFNEYTVRVVDKRVTITVNGETTVDDNFPTVPDDGVIGWQLHGGYPGQEVRFKDITFVEPGAK